MKSRRELDFELVEAVKAGDAHALESLIQRYRRPLTRYLSLMMRDPGDTEDVVQETFIKAYAALRNFRGDSSFATWLFMIGINTAKHTLVKNGRRIPRISDPQGEEPGNPHGYLDDVESETPETQLEDKETLSLLDHALARLPSEQRISFELRELEGLSYEDIAAQMHCPVGTVRSRIHRARDALAEALKAGKHH